MNDEQDYLKKMRQAYDDMQAAQEEYIARVVQTQIKYLLAEGIIIQEGTSASGEATYRLKSEEEIQAELDEIINS